MRLIDADALHKAYMELRNFKQDPQSGDWISLRAVPLTTVIRILNEAPSIDIVRCKECKWAKANGTYQWCGRLDSTAQITADDFCSYGVRKTNTTAEEKPTPIRDYMVHGERKESE